MLMKLLAWIDRVDRCSQLGEPRPPFQDESGGFIFPPEGHEDEKWWLTEMSLRKEQEKQARAGDLEEGAPSEATNDDDLVSEKDINKLTDDDGSDDDDEDLPDSRGSLGNSPVLPVRLTRHSSRASWTRGSSSQWDNSQECATPAPSNDAVAQHEPLPSLR